MKGQKERERERERGREREVREWLSEKGDQ